MPPTDLNTNRKNMLKNMANRFMHTAGSVSLGLHIHSSWGKVYHIKGTNAICGKADQIMITEKRIKLDTLLDKIRATVKNHELENGAYARWLWQDQEGTRKMGPNEYGCADAANILYMLGDMPRDTQVRQSRVNALKEFQNPDTGLFWEGTHHELHCTAHCTAALELFDALPGYPLTGLSEFKTREGLEGLLDRLDWENKPWQEAHQGAGVFAAMILSREASEEWQDWYFEWLTDRTDPEYGLSRAGSIQKGKRPVYEHLNGWFHYLFNFHFAHRPFPYAERLIDTCIDLYRNRKLSDSFGKYADFKEIDWVFTLNRAVMQTGYRFQESRELLRDFAGTYIPQLEATDIAADESWNDLHRLFGAVCAIAELQIALPGELRCAYPLKQVLDRRPFI